MQLREIIEQIVPGDERAFAACSARFDAVAKPLGSLGMLEELLCRIAAADRDPGIHIEKKCTLVFCADNGVLAQGVTQCGSDVTTAIARSLAAGTASVNAMSQACGAQVFPVDMGMIDTVPGVLDRKLARGTRDISQGPAMTREMAEQALLTGVEQVGLRKKEGFRLIAVGEAGIGNTTTTSAVAAVLLGRRADEVTGRGSGLTDEGLNRKQRAIARALEVNAPDPDDPVDVLSKVGGLDLAAMTGAFLGGAFHQVPMVMDGVISTVAALCAVRLCPAVRDYLIPSHVSAEPAGKLVMEALDFRPIIHGGLRLGEGTGAVALFPLLDLSAAVYHNAATFNAIEVPAYVRLS